MIKSINTLGKFLDQPILVSKLDKAMPAMVSLGASAYLAHDVFQKDKKGKITKEDKKDFLEKAVVMAFSVASAFLAPKIASKITGRNMLAPLEKVKEKNTELIENFKKDNKLSEKMTNVLNKGKEKILSFGEVGEIFEELGKNKKGKEFLLKLIPDPENIKARDIFSEIGYLSIYGAVPVIGGITGGILSDKIIEPETAEAKIPNKISEGIFQYLANIFMCNVGAGAALACLEKLNITSKAARALGMTAGIILTGVVGGAKIANTISKKVINPFLPKDKKLKERIPEPMDLCMHTDDIATVSLLSGLKWIEPALPVLYTVSGYKAGTGYTNNK